MAWRQTTDQRVLQVQAIATHALFRVIADFRLGVDESTAPMSLATTANALLELARLYFVLMERELWCSTSFHAEANACIVELEGLVAALSDNQRLAPVELIHAMDSLIALLVQAVAVTRPARLSADANSG
jgi:hypothetical protein